MTTKSSNTKKPADRVMKDIRRATRRHFSAEDKIRCYSARGLDADRHDKPLKTRLSLRPNDGAE